MPTRPVPAGTPIVSRLTQVRLDPASWTRAGANLLVKGRARIAAPSVRAHGEGEKGAGAAPIYAVVLRNDSDVDLWPYLAYMDAGGYSIAMVYHPDPAGGPPLRKHSHMVVGSGATESDALSFALAEGEEGGGGFLKLFVSTAYSSMSVLEQGPTTTPVAPTSCIGCSKAAQVAPDSTLWDTVLTSISVVRTPS